MRVVVSTGEASGRLLARHVEVELERRAPGVELVRFNADRARGAVFGFAEGLRAAPALARDLAVAGRQIVRLAPDLVLLVGFSNFNLPLGRRCRRSGLPVAFLAPPQLWAWGGWRAGVLRRAADLVVCLFGFEADWLRRRGIRAEFVGNPLVDAAGGRARQAAGGRRIAFLPGSRPAETSYHRRVFAAVELPGYRREFVELEEPDEPARLLAAAARRYDVMAGAEAAVVVSGTATLETALLGVPQVACYHLTPATRFLARMLVRGRRFALPNILLGRDVMPELLDPSPADVVRALSVLLADPGSGPRARQAAIELRELLGPPGATGRIAELLLRTARG